MKQECTSDRECGNFGICLGNWDSCECACVQGYTRKIHRCVEDVVGLTKGHITGIAIAVLLLSLLKIRRWKHKVLGQENSFIESLKFQSIFWGLTCNLLS